MRKALILILFIVAIGCTKSASDSDDVFDGKLNKNAVRGIRGFVENRDAILQKIGVEIVDFVSLSTDSAWSLSATNQQTLKTVRLNIESPTASTMFQKVIPLEDVATYMNNTYGGTVGGFVTVAADSKNLTSMSEVYWGLRLDYEGTKFRENGAGYAVLRFYSEAVSKLTIPFCEEMGGVQVHAWPNTGGGFTSSSLGEGGIAEYTFVGYSAPKDGAELYEVTPSGREILRSTYVSGKGWTTNEIGSLSPNISLKTVRNGVVVDAKSGKQFVTTYATYKNNRYIVRGLINDEYHLTTTTPYENVNLEVMEKGIYGIQVRVSEIEKIWEETENLN